MEKYTFSEKTEEEALEAALSELNVSKEDILYETKEQKGGLFKGKKVEIIVTKKSDINEYIKDTVTKIVTDMGFDVKIETKVRDGILNLTLHSDNNNLLIGRDGKNMNALSTVVKQIIQNELGMYYKFNLDVSNYKDKIVSRLERLAKRTAKEVLETKVPVALDNMTSYERRIIHNALTNFKGISSDSEGEEPNRHIVIKPVK